MCPGRCAGLGLLLVLAFVASCTPPSAPSSAATHKLAQGPHAVREVLRTWHDVQRRREIPVRVYIPDADAGPYPVIVFSHGLGASRDDYAYLGRHWASYGYVCAHPTHPGTDYAAIFADGEVVRNLLDFSNDASWRADRPADVSFVLDQLESHYQLGPLVDMQRVGVAGHSLGAYTALALIGLRIDLPNRLGVQPIDPRVKAVVAMSPPGEGAFGLREGAWEDLRTPCLMIIGTRDWDLATVDPARRRIAFTHSGGPDQYLLTIQTATHGTFNDSFISMSDRLSHARYHRYVEMVTTAFFNAHLKDDAVAQEWLLNGALTDLSEGACSLEWKNLTRAEEP